VSVTWTGALPAWCTVNVCVAMASAPVRGALSVFVAAAHRTSPSPLPETPAVIVSHGALLVAFHAQSARDAVTRTIPSVSAAPIETSLGEMS
jgi:hypothetical protein